MKGRLIALDIGAKRIGLARTDVLQLSVNPAGTHHVNALPDVLDQMIHQEGPVEALIFGWPLNEGQEGKATVRVQQWMNRFKNKYPDLPQHKVDESFSSVEAQALQLQAGVKKSKRQDKSRIDELAAVLILKRYLDSF